MTKHNDYIVRDAYIIDNYRYKLTRIWNQKLDKITFIMLNPSTADADLDDPTILSCRRHAENWGYGGFEVVNLFAYKSTDMSALNNINECIIGKENDKYIKLSIERANKVILAWGNALSEKKVTAHPERVNKVVKILGDIPLYCITLTQKGCPKHPLYSRTTDEPVEVIWDGKKLILKP